eukprot:GHVR01098034.1.p2 GENE.GHVR01098034.1~~GHVR01098034.1.p2  ORF type:complete len:178 (-),score=22.56 GHVR01098034.1:1075-1608(-)
MKPYIGIDCGLDGGIVTLDCAGNIIDQRVMPVVAMGKGRKIDLQALDSFFDVATGSALNGDAATIIIEQPGGHAPSAAGLRSMTYSFAVCEALCVAHGLRYHEVTSQKWQREFWSKSSMPKGKKFDTKAAALAECKKLWATNEWRQVSEKTGKLLKNAHDGITDAALLAEYGRRKNI